MSSVVWKTGTSGTWTTAANWAGGTAPTAADDVTIAAAPATSGVPYIVDFATSESVHSVTLNQALAELQIDDSTLSIATTFALTAGTLDLDYGTLSGGIYTSTAGTVMVTGYGTLSNLTWNGLLDLTADPATNYGYVYLNGVTFRGSAGTGAGTVTVGAGIDVVVGQTLLNSATASFSNGSTLTDYSGSLTIGPAFTLSTSGSSAAGTYTTPASVYVATSLVNQGIISDTSGATLTIQANSFSNAGTIMVGAGSVIDISSLGTAALVNTGLISVGNGGYLALEPAGSAGVTNTGSISVTGGTLALDFSLTTAKLLTFPVASGTLALLGTLTNTSTTFTVGSTGKIANLLLAGGEIMGGTIVSPGGLTVEGAQSAAATLSNVTVDGTLSIGTPNVTYFSGPTVDILNTLHMAGATGTGVGTIAIGNGANLGFTGTQSLTNAAIAFGTASTNATLSTSSTITAGQYNESAATTFTLGATTILTQGATDDYITATTTNDLIINAGTINAGAAKGEFSVENFKNIGVISITNGDSFYWQSNAPSATTLTNTGRITVSGGTLGIYTDTLLNAGTLSLAGTSSAVTNAYYYNDGLSIDNSGSILLSTGATLTLGYGGAAWTNTGTIQVNAADLSLDGTFTTAQMGSIAITNAGTLGIGGTLTNSGTLSVGTGKTLSSVALLSGGEISGGIIADAGNGLLAQGGTLSGVGYHGVLNLSAAASTLTIANGLVMTAASGSGQGTILATGSSTNLDVFGTQTISSALIDLGSSASSQSNAMYFVDASTSGTLTPDTLTLAAGDTLAQTGKSAAIYGNLSYYTGYLPSGDTLVNKGSITENVAGSVLTLEALAVTNAGSISVAGGSQLDLFGTTLTNNGTLSLTGTGTAISFGTDFGYAAGFTNAGVVSIGPGASLGLTQGLIAWSNTGTIKDAGGTLTLGGTFTSAQLGIVQISAGGIVDLAGTLQNAGTLALGTGAALSTLTLLAGGEISGGTVKNAGNGLAGSGGTLSGVTYVGALALSGNGTRLTVANGLTMAGTAGTGIGTLQVSGPSSELVLLGNETLTSTVVDFGISPTNGYYYSNSLDIQDLPSGAATITIGAGSSLVQTGLEANLYGTSAYSGTAYGPTGDTLVNDGTFTETLANAYLNDSDVDVINAGKMSIGNGAEFAIISGTLSNTSTLMIATASKTSYAPAELTFNDGGYAGSENFTNTGLVTIGAGGLLNLSDPDLAWSNSGTFQVSGGDLVLGGTFTGAQIGTLLVSGGGTVAIAGTLTNSGTLVVGAGTSLSALTLVSGGTISGGTIADAGGGIITAGGTLSGVTYQGTLNLASFDTSLTIAGGLAMAGTGGSGAGTIMVTADNGTLAVLGSQVLSNAVLDYTQPSTDLANYDANLDLRDLSSGATTLTLAATSSLMATRDSTDIAGSYTYANGTYTATGDTLINDGSISETGAEHNLDVSLVNLQNAGQIAIQGGAGCFIDQATLTNSGTISISGTGTAGNGGIYNAYLAFASYNGSDTSSVGFTNTGLVNVGSGGELSLDSTTASLTWSNTGSIAVSGGELDLGGGFITAQLGKITVSAGGDVFISADGTLNNTGATLTVGGTSALGSVSLQGTIHGGTILDDGNGFLFGSGYNGQTGQYNTADLDAVKYEGTLAIATAYEDLLITGGISVTGTAGTGTGVITLTGAGAVLDFVGAQKLALATVSIGAAFNGPTLTGNALTLANTINQVGATATIGSTGSTITATGHINGAQDGGTLTLAGDIINSGTIAISNGETLLLDTSALTNTGVIRVTNGLLDAVNVTASQLSEITLVNSPLAVTGTLTAIGSTLTVGAGTALPLIELAGTIVGGVINDAGGGVGYYGNAVLDGVTYQGTLNVTRPLSSVTIQGGLTATDVTGKLAGSIDVTGAGSDLVWDSTQALNNATLTIGNFGTTYEGTQVEAPALAGGEDISTVLLGASLTILQATSDGFSDIGGLSFGDDYLDSAAGSFVSAATIEATAYNANLSLTGENFQNTGTIVISNRETVSAAAADFLNAGKITISTGSTLGLNLYNYFLDDNFAPESFTNTGSISLAGGVLTELDDGATFPSVPLLNAAGGTIGGYGNVQSGIVNNGTITAQGGRLLLGQAVTGTGTLLVSGSATLALSHVSSGETAGFIGTGGLLVFSPPTFLGKIGAFSSGDTLALVNTAATAAHFTTTSLVVTLSTGSTIALATASALTGSLTVGADSAGDALVSFSSAALKPAGSGSPTPPLTPATLAGPSVQDSTPLGVAWHPLH